MNNIRKFVIGTLVLITPLIVAGAWSDSQQPPPQRVEQPAQPQPGSGGNFLPLWLDQLQGKGQPPDDACHPKTLTDMLTPCDTDNKGFAGQGGSGTATK